MVVCRHRSSHGGDLGDLPPPSLTVSVCCATGAADVGCGGRHTGGRRSCWCRGLGLCRHSRCRLWSRRSHHVRPVGVQAPQVPRDAPAFFGPGRHTATDGRGLRRPPILLRTVAAPPDDTTRLVTEARTIPPPSDHTSARHLPVLPEHRRQHQLRRPLGDPLLPRHQPHHTTRRHRPTRPRHQPTPRDSRYTNTSGAPSTVRPPTSTVPHRCAMCKRTPARAARGCCAHAPRERWRVAAPPAHPACCASRVTVRPLRSRTRGTVSRYQASASLQSGRRVRCAPPPGSPSGCASRTVGPADAGRAGKGWGALVRVGSSVAGASD